MIASLWIGEVAGNPDAANADVLVTLEDGRGYAFTAFTPRALADEMTRDGEGFFNCDDLLVVREVTEACVRAAVEDVVRNRDVERYGIRQSA